MRFGDDAASIVRNLDDWKPDPLNVRHIEPLGRDPAGNLCTAFDQVPGNRRSRKSIPIVPCPAEPMSTRAYGQTRIGYPAGNDQVGALGECFCDGLRTEIRIGGDKSISY